MIRFKVFHNRNEVAVKYTWYGVFGKEHVDERYEPIYKTLHDLYAAVAAFANSVGDRLVAITGTPWGEGVSRYTVGDVVVWYREEVK